LAGRLRLNENPAQGNVARHAVGEFRAEYALRPDYLKSWSPM